MDEGYTIPLAQTAAPVQLDQILSTLQADTRANLKLLLARARRGVRGRRSRGAERGAGPSDEAFTQGAMAAEAFRGTDDDDLPGFVDAGGDVAAARARTAPADLVEGLNRSARALASRRAELSASLPELDRLLEEADPALDAFNAAFPPTRALVRDARPGVQAAPETLELAIPVLEQARQLVAPAELPALVDELDPAVRSLARLEPDLTELARRRDPGHRVPAPQRGAHAEEARSTTRRTRPASRSTASCCTPWSAWRARRRTSTATARPSATTRVAATPA